MLDSVVNLAHSAVSTIATGVEPAFGPAATAAAIVLFTVAVRLLISPLSWAQIRGARVSPLAGCLPALVQAPFFFLMYRLFTKPGDLLDATLAGVPLGHHLTDGLSLSAVLVYAVLLALLTALARLSARRMREAPVAAAPSPEVERMQEQMRRLMVLLPYGTLAVAAFVPLAAGLYLVTTTAWTALEQGVLRRYR
ncbi:YidC/Oxa1 family membrane protein insertase [Phytohabitans houttuyneae]|uniref:Membrane protein insertase YidC n=1 Tax=Phytohabitans houttuyneae TaxID=1076126 RepID=A0A6V8K0E6_9ACTN|nr:YidC/Oxa1 family membrane protein insertase [Phytohabitans houttuyneae]GFJ78613.1 protein translocase component YidC [Phytohabitans houttuyneae]